MVVGDIHGDYGAFAALLEAVQPKRDDTLVTPGDYIDRGPQSHEVVERLILLQEETNLIPLLGNHEEMLLTCRDNYLAMIDIRLENGGRATIRSYCRARGVALNSIDT